MNDFTQELLASGKWHTARDERLNALIEKHKISVSVPNEIIEFCAQRADKWAADTTARVVAKSIRNLKLPTPEDDIDRKASEHKQKIRAYLDQH